MRFFCSSSEPEPLEPWEGDSERGAAAAVLGAGAFFFGGAGFAPSSSASPVFGLGLVTPDLERVPWRPASSAEGGCAGGSSTRGSHAAGIVTTGPSIVSRAVCTLRGARPHRCSI